MPRKPPKGKSLAEVNPELAKQWHPTKNGDLTANDVMIGSRHPAWWKCSVKNHEWTAPVSRRKKGAGCPFCTGRKAGNDNSLKRLHPELSKQWHPTKNGDLTSSDVTAGSNRKVWWQCKKDANHEWDANIFSRVNGRGCPYCSHRIFHHNDREDSLAHCFPNLIKEWDFQLNKTDPFKIYPNSNKPAFWICINDSRHKWSTKIINRTVNKAECPYCTNNKVGISNCLKTTHPEVAKEWHLTKNGDLTPLDLSFGSNRRVWWQCSKDSNHEWLASIKRKVSKHTACPYCTLTPQSRQELMITFELIRFFKDINPKGFKTTVKGKVTSIDIYIPQLKLGIEFDGSYWHKDKHVLDKLKTENLEEEGFEIFRVREEPLKRIFADDIMSKQPFNAKQVTNDILTQIMSRYSLNAKKIAKIESYITKKELQNDKGLDKYIDMILTEKAEKKVI
jgi:very-short-patch-repair endonuclease